MLISCNLTDQTSTKISADLYYNWLKLGSFYGRPESLLTNYLNQKDSLGYEGMMKEDSSTTKYLKVLEENDLLMSPFIYLKADNGHTFLLFMNEGDFSNFNSFNYHELIDNSQKVRVEAEIDSLYDNMYFCKKIISVKVTEGQTLQKEGKFKIEEYR
ncbi:MAG: hypothetical protein CL924_00140 [Deltaproteobacteria bacterium]|nr:MAG: hypothetical protein CL924_00140 [Deltaproteobacteria bacterium]|tara:strand:- start:8 stop:478 length:471 start_codon:yes stop_codon:yes gene_type:complete